MSQDAEGEVRPAAKPGLTSGGRIARNTVWNFTGQALPLVVGIVAVPILVREMGTDRFGILTLVWMVIGYFSLFDFGLGRALTKLVAEKLGADLERDVPGLAWVALVTMTALGVIGAIVCGLLSPWVARDVLRIEPALQGEAATAFVLLAATIPIVITSTALRGVLEAYQRFDLVVMVRVPSGTWTFLGPVLATLAGGELVAVVVVLAIGRSVAWVAFLLFCVRTVARFMHPDWSGWRTSMHSLISFGGWMTVSNVVGPLMVRVDRFVIGATMTMAAVAYYATPYEFITRLWIVPSAIVGVLFPAFSSALVRDRGRAEQLFERGNRYLFLAVFPIAFTVVAAAPEGLDLWLGADFARESTPVLRWLAFGVWVNCLAHVPFALIQADGRPDITAKLHLLEAPLYLLLLWQLLRSHGIEGAAIAWTVRVVIDTAALHVFAIRRLPEIGQGALRRVAAVLVGSVLFGAITLVDPAPARALVVAGVLALFALVSWTRLLRPDERAVITSRLMRKSGGS